MSSSLCPSSRRPLRAAPVLAWLMALCLLLAVQGPVWAAAGDHASAHWVAEQAVEDVAAAPACDQHPGVVRHCLCAGACVGLPSTLALPAGLRLAHACPACVVPVVNGLGRAPETPPPIG